MRALKHDSFCIYLITKSGRRGFSTTVSFETCQRLQSNSALVSGDMKFSTLRALILGQIAGDSCI